MIRHSRLEHRFVKHVPEKLEPGVLYVSIEYASAAHSCCCGCGEEVMTPLAPTGWTLSYNGEAVSLWPSIGNWNLRCRSHYIIDGGRVTEALPWTTEEIAAGRRRDKADRARYYSPESPKVDSAPAPKPAVAQPRGKWATIAHWWSSLRR